MASIHTHTIKTVFLAITAFSASACTNMNGYNSYAFQPPLQVDMAYLAQQNQLAQNNAPAMQAPTMSAPNGYQQQAQQPILVTTQEDQRVSALTGELTQMQDRLSRTERAMLRLDRRMQLVENNELSRMGGDQLSSLPPTTGLANTTSQRAQPYLQKVSMNMVPRQNNQGTMRVSSALQPVQQARTALASLNAPSGQGRALLGLPSLADKPEKTSNETPSELSVWTVRYEPSKIWPDRGQLKSSRDVVSALRTANGRPIAVYARGKNTSSKEFRERVRALSRYLSKVGEKQRVPIAALPADHLDADTIEIFTAN